MMFILFFVALSRAQSEAPAETVSACGTTQYYDILAGECVERKDCLEYDDFYGCTKCNQGYYPFKGVCKLANCDSFEKEVGCKECDKNDKKYVMVETTYVDGSADYQCVDVSTTNDDDDEDMKTLKSDTQKLCREWDQFGCTKCYQIEGDKITAVGMVSNGFCVRNGNCSSFEPIKDKNNIVIGAKCTKCDYEKDNAISKKQYYLNEHNFCVPCDEHCEECELDSGACIKCADDYVTYNNSVSRKCYPCDENCAFGQCVMDTTAEHHIVCKECAQGYFKVNNSRCVRCPEGCIQSGNCVDEVGCVDCDDPKTHFLIPNDYLSTDGKKSGFHYNLSGVHIGYCVPHQEECPYANRSIHGCSGCNKGYVLDKVTYHHGNQADYWTGFCSGASQLMVIYLIGLLLFLAF